MLLTSLSLLKSLFVGILNYLVLEYNNSNLVQIFRDNSLECVLLHLLIDILYLYILLLLLTSKYSHFFLIEIVAMLEISFEIFYKNDLY